MHNVSDKVVARVLFAIEVATMLGEPVSMRDMSDLSGVSYPHITRAVKLLVESGVLEVCSPIWRGGGGRKADPMLFTFTDDFVAQCDDFEMSEGHEKAKMKAAKHNIRRHMEGAEGDWGEYNA
jgi:pyruvate-formate lyase-activating enzyme